MKLKLDNRAKDSIVKLLALVVVMIVLTVVLALILDRVVGAADLVEETELVGGVIADVADETASEMAEDGMIVANTDEPDEILVEDDQLGFFDEVGDAFTDYIDSVSDLLFGTDDDVFPGVPSDVPPDALSWPESGALIEPESEVLMELKAIDFSDYPYDESWAVALA